MEQNDSPWVARQWMNYQDNGKNVVIPKGFGLRLEYEGRQRG